MLKSVTAANRVAHISNRLFFPGVPKGGDALSPLQQRSEAADAPLTSLPHRH